MSDNPTSTALVVRRRMTCSYLPSIPMAIVQLHRRVINGQASAYLGSAKNLAKINILPADAKRWPTTLAGVKKIWMVYSGKK